MTVTKDEIRAFEIYKELRESDKVCCLTICSDYDYCYEVKWSYPEKDGHKKYRTACHDDLLSAMLEAQKKIVTMAE